MEFQARGYYTRISKYLLTEGYAILDVGGK